MGHPVVPEQTAASSSSLAPELKLLLPGGGGGGRLSADPGFSLFLAKDLFGAAITTTTEGLISDGGRMPACVFRPQSPIQYTEY